MIKLKPLLSGFLFIVSSTNMLSSISRNWDLLDNLNLGAFLWLELAQLGISWSPTCVTEVVINLQVSRGIVVGAGKRYEILMMNPVFLVKIREILDRENVARARISAFQLDRSWEPGGANIYSKRLNRESQGWMTIPMPMQ